MTQKDIRDIAAYWGVPFKGQVYVQSSALFDREPNVGVDGAVLAALQNKDYDSFKLKLRPLQSVAHSEWVHIYHMLYENTDEPEDYQTWAAFLADWYEGVGSIEIERIATITAYLQSIGVYVPGSIDPQYVELLP